MTAANEPRPVQFNYQYPSQQYPGQYYQPQPGPAPEQFNGNNNKNGKFPTWAKITAGGLAITAAIGGGLFAKSQFDSADKAETVATGETIPGQEAKPTLPLETVSLVEEFDSQRSEILSEMLDRFTKDGYNLSDYHQYEGRTIEAASPTMSAQAILDRMSAKEYFLTNNPDRTEAHTQVQLEARPGSQAYSAVESSIDHSMKLGLPSSDEERLIKSKSFDNGTLIDPTTGDTIVSANDTPTVLVSSMSLRARTNAVRVFQYEESADGKTGDWRLVYSIPADKSGFDVHTIDQVSVVE